MDLKEQVEILRENVNLRGQLLFSNLMNGCTLVGLAMVTCASSGLSVAEKILVMVCLGLMGGALVLNAKVKIVSSV